MSQIVIPHTAYKRTTDKQYSLMTHEMAGLSLQSCRGKNADAIMHWNNLTEKLNELGPPYRTVQQWRKVWSDLRLHITKRKAKKPKKPKKTKKEPKHVEEDNLMEALNSSISIYGTHIDHSDNEEIEDAIKDNETYEDFEEEHSGNEQIKDAIKEEETDEVFEADEEEYKKDVEQTVVTVQNQLEKQEQLMDNLLKVSSNIATLMQRHLKAVERKTSIMERQLKLNKYHNVFLRRKEAKKFKKL
ncbi:uncharacterized protein LOC135952014 [Calliphora vicina]|uniref:uncharacterized protein LOC135952014 n=1 Tax=Calliphora vicina TaxID=7373 RepID=UPI00325C0A02